MAEKQSIGKTSIGYEGLFNVFELYKILDDWQKKNNYDKTEKESIEYIKPEGKYIELHLEPYRKESDYVKFVIKIDITMENVKETVVEIDDEKKNMHEGKVSIDMEAWLETDYEGTWQMKPGIYFLRILVDKYIYKIYTGKFSSALKKEFDQLSAQVKSFLNLYKYQH